MEAMVAVMCKHNWEKGWLDEILDQADRAVQDWPEWMRDLRLRYPMNRGSSSQSKEVMMGTSPLGQAASKAK